MILKADAAQLEWRVKVWLAQDSVGMKEIDSGFDLHSDNQQVFGLPSRLIAKIFIYRMIFADAFGPKGYSGPAYAYANDTDFSVASSSVKFWENVIDRFFNKYPQVKQHSLDLIQEAIYTGGIECPSGRFFKFPQEQTKHGLDWPRTKILNYPIQGTAAEFMVMARLAFWNRLKKVNYGHDLIKLFNTVHDDIEVDVANDPELVYNICILLEDCFRDIPINFERCYKIKVNVPQAGEVKFGMSLYEKDMVKFNKETFYTDWKNYTNANRNS